MKCNLCGIDTQVDWWDGLDYVICLDCKEIEKRKKEEEELSKKYKKFISEYHSHPIEIDENSISFYHGGNYLNPKQKVLDLNNVKRIKVQGYHSGSLWLINYYFKIYIYLRNSNRKYTLYGEYGFKIVSKILQHLNEHFPNRLQFTSLDEVWKHKEEQSKHIRFLWKLFALASIVLSIMILFKKMTPDEFEYDEIIRRTPEISELWFQGASRQFIPCPESQYALFTTNNPDKFILIHSCKWFNFQIDYGLKELSYDEANRQFNLDYMKNIVDKP